MRRDKIVARILLIFSIANAVLAAPAVVRQRLFDRAGDKSTDEPTPSLGSGSGYLPDYEASPGPDTPPLLSDDSDTSSSFHLSSTFDTDKYYADQLSPSHFDSMTESWDGSSSAALHSAGVPESVAPQLDDDPPSASGSQQLNDPTPTSGRPPSQDHPTPESEAAQLHNPLPGSGDQPLHDDSLPWWHDYYPMTMPVIEEKEEDKVKSIGICGHGPFSCWESAWDWDFSRSFE